MIVKKAKYKKVKRIVTEQVSPDVYGCDECKKEFGEEQKLEISVHFHDEEKWKQQHNGSIADRHQFCSWDCVAKFIPKVKTDYFVVLPFLHYDSKNKGTTINDFLKILKTK